MLANRIGADSFLLTGFAFEEKTTCLNQFVQKDDA